MPSFLRTLILACIFLGVTLGLVTTIAMAKTYKHYSAHHHRTHHLTHHASRGDARLRTAQYHLINLDYYSGKVDGRMGPKTKIAFKHFQRDHKLPVNGKLTTRTYNAILEADKKAPVAAAAPQPVVPAEDFYATHKDFYGHYDQEYADPMLTAPSVVGNGNAAAARTQPIPSRYAKLDLSEDVQGSLKHYTLTMNDQPVVTADDQPSVIGVSRTFELGNEDAIIVSTYRSESTICSYRNYLLTLHAESNKVQEIGNCTHGYQASVKDGSLFIIFPEGDTGRAVGNTWRYDNGALEQL